MEALLKKKFIMMPKVLFMVIFSGIFACFSSLLYAQTMDPPQANVSQPGMEMNEKPVNMVQLSSFYLTDETLVSGRVVFDDGNGITLDVLEDGKIKRVTYPYRIINIRTRTIRTMTELDYYEHVARYFAGQTGDFINDPDDFIQAIRFYEKALRLLQDHPQKNVARINSIKERIEDLNQDREVWVRETQDRARLLELEDKATLNQRFEELKQENDRLNRALTAVKDDIKNLQDDFSFLNRDLNWQLRRLEDETLPTSPREVGRRDYRQRFDDGYYGPYINYGRPTYYGPGYYYGRPSFGNGDGNGSDDQESGQDIMDRPNSELNPTRPRPIQR